MNGLGTPETLLTVSEIADLADVSRSAVSNWRRRYRDFPEPAATAAGGGDVFRLGEIETWLRRNNKRIKRHTGIEKLWALADGARGSHSIDQITEAACATLALCKLDPSLQHWLADPIGPTDNHLAALRQRVADVERRDPRLRGAFETLTSTRVDRELLAIIATVAQLAATEGIPELFEKVRNRRATWHTYRGHEYDSSDELAALVVALAEPHGVVFDPSAGEGTFLLAAAQAATGQLELFGQELNDAARRLAQLRLIVHGVNADLVGGDSLLEDRFSGLSADVVVCDPPYGQRWNAPRATHDPRWIAGIPGESNADLAWLQHAISHLAPDGRGYVLLPQSSLFRGGRDARIRGELVRQGCIEAVIALPGGANTKTTLPLGLWLVGTPSSRAADRGVLVIDATRSDPERKTNLVDRYSRIIDAVAQFRSGADVLELEPGLAAVVPTLSLLAPEATLVPGRWLAPTTTVDAAEQVATAQRRSEALIRARERALGTPPPPRLQLQTTSNRPMVRLGEICAIQKGTSIPKAAYAPSGTPVLRSPWSRRDDQRYVDLEEIPRRITISEPNEVIFVGLGDTPRAFIDIDGGHVLPDYMYAIRPSDDSYHPLVLSWLLSAPIQRRLVTGVSIPRVNPRDIEVPILSAAESNQLRQTLARLSEYEQTGEQLRGTATATRDALVDGIASGQLELVSNEPLNASPKQRGVAQTEQPE